MFGNSKKTDSKLLAADLNVFNDTFFLSLVLKKSRLFGTIIVSFISFVLQLKICTVVGDKSNGLEVIIFFLQVQE